MKPILKYPGAKWRLAQWVISHMPPHEIYIEPYFGSGGVFFNKAPCRIETINDLDGAVTHFFMVCRSRPDELAYAVSMTPWAREEFQNCDFIEGDDFTDDVERARQFLVRCWMTFGARTRCKTGWRNTQRNGPDNPAMWRRLPEIISQVADRLRDAQIDNRPAVDVITRNSSSGALIYADPPYVTSTRVLNGSQYRHEMTDADHEELLHALLSFKGMVLLSGYDSELYNDALRGWRKETCTTTAETGVKRTECLWLNPRVCEWHDATEQMAL